MGRCYRRGRAQHRLDIRGEHECGKIFCWSAFFFDFIRTMHWLLKLRAVTPTPVTALRGMALPSEKGGEGRPRGWCCWWEPQPWTGAPGWTWRSLTPHNCEAARARSGVVVEALFGRIFVKGGEGGNGNKNFDVTVPPVVVFVGRGAPCQRFEAGRQRQQQLWRCGGYWAPSCSPASLPRKARTWWTLLFLPLWNRCCQHRLIS